jgi:hypothetical protein
VISAVPEALYLNVDTVVSHMEHKQFKRQSYVRADKEGVSAVAVDEPAIASWIASMSKGSCVFFLSVSSASRPWSTITSHCALHEIPLEGQSTLAWKWKLQKYDDIFKVKIWERK